MRIPESDTEMKTWLEANIAPLQGSEDNTVKFKENVFFSKGGTLFPLDAGKKKPMSLHAFFNNIVLHTTRFDHIQIGNPATRCISVDRSTLEVTELPVPARR